MKIFDNVLAVVVGSMGGMIAITFMEIGIHKQYPLPPGTDMYNADSLAKGIATLPTNAFVLVLVSYVIASFIAGIIATLLSKRVKRNPPLVVGVILTLAGVYNIVNLHQPSWFSVASMFSYLPFAYLGYLVSKKRSATTIIDQDKASCHSS